MQMYELTAWLGDDHNLNDDQLDELLGQAAEIHKTYPDLDDQLERDAALTAAYRIISGEEGVVEDLARDLDRARRAMESAFAGLKQAAAIEISSNRETEAGFARRANVDRMTVRKWLGKRSRTRKDEE